MMVKDRTGSANGKQGLKASDAGSVLICHQL
jgi:hypothetical protein